MDINAKITSRQRVNRELIKLIEHAVEEHPTWRFGQILYNMGIVRRIAGGDLGTVGDPFFEESVDTLHNVAEEYLGIDELD